MIERQGILLLMKSIVAAVAIAILLSSVVSVAHAQAAPELGKSFELKFGQKASIDSEKIGITFANVTEDSRCPSDVVCIQAGQATIRASVEVNGTDAGQAALTVGPKGKDSATIGQYSVRLVKLDPYPVSKVHTALEDYVATLVVSKASASSVFVKARGEFSVIAGWKGDKGTLVTLGRDPQAQWREVIRFVPTDAKCDKPDASNCIDGEITPTCLACMWQRVHLETSSSKLYLTLQGQSTKEYSLDIKQIKVKQGSTVTLAEGQRAGPLLVQKIGADYVSGLNYIEYPVARQEGIPVTLHVGDKVSNGCTVTLSLLEIQGGGSNAVFSKTVNENRPCPL